VGQFAGLRFADPIFLAIGGIADPNLLRTYNFRKSENSFFTNTYLEFSNSNF
jgi:hypothetical protein